MGLIAVTFAGVVTREAEGSLGGPGLAQYALMPRVEVLSLADTAVLEALRPPEFYTYYIVTSDIEILAIAQEEASPHATLRFALARDEGEMEAALTDLERLNAERERDGLPTFHLVDAR